MPKEKKADKPKKSPKKEPKYIVSLIVNGETSVLEGDTLHEALKSFICPDFVKTGIRIEVKSGDKRADELLNTFKTRHAFSNKTALELLAVNLERRLG